MFQASRLDHQRLTSENDTYYTFIFEKGVGSGYGIQRIHQGVAEQLQIQFNDDVLLYRSYEAIPAEVADLIDIACVIYATDGFTQHKLDAPARVIEVELPLRRPEHMNPHRVKLLEDLLAWTTETQYHFRFVKRAAVPRKAESRHVIPTGGEGVDTMLWSGGLDALAGCYNRLKKYPHRSIILISSGGNKRVMGKQKELFKQLKNEFGRLLLYQLPLHLPAGERNNKLMRSRGVVFLLLGSAVSYLMNARKLHVYENGIGAMNLPYLSSSVGLAHTRSVHPFTLQKVAAFVASVAEEDFKILNPFFLQTKAETCQKRKDDYRGDLVAMSESCDSYHRKNEGQCGYCTSCLLRRQALAAAGIKDTTNYVITGIAAPKRDPTGPLKAMLYQVHELQATFSNSRSEEEKWCKFARKYPQVDDVMDELYPVDPQTSLFEVQQNPRRDLLKMYETYVQEWLAVKDQLSKGILDWKDPKKVA